MVSFKKASILFTLVVSLIASYIFLSQGIFILISETSISRDNLSSSENIYMGNSVGWRGRLRPEILDIQVVDQNTRIIAFDKTSIEIYIEESGHIGVVSESQGKNLSLNLIKPHKYKVKNKNFNIVLKLGPNTDEKLLEEVKGIKISYSVLGKEKSQIITLKSLIQ